MCLTTQNYRSNTEKLPLKTNVNAVSFSREQISYFNNTKSPLVMIQGIPKTLHTNDTMKITPHRLPLLMTQSMSQTIFSSDSQGANASYRTLFYEK